MKRRIFFVTAFLILAACSAPGVQEQVTATDLSSQTLQPASPTSTVTASSTPRPTSTPTLLVSSSTDTKSAAQGTISNGLPTEVSATEKADRSDNKAVLLFQNNSGQIVRLTIDSPTYLQYQFSDSFIILLPLGVYHYRVWIGEQGPFEGDIHIGSHDKHVMIFSAGKVQVRAP